MSDLLAIFFWPMVASLVMGVVLNLLGIQLAARDKTIQSLCISQGSVFGVLLGIGLASFFHDSFAQGLPFVCSICGAGLLFLMSERVTQSLGPHKTTALVVIYVFLLALGHLVAALFPGVELHLSQKFFGDLATVSDRDAQLSIVGAICSSPIFWYFHRAFTRDSFEIAILNAMPKWNAPRVVFLLFEFFAIAYSVMIFGFLFTVACLFRSTTFVARARNSVGWIRHYFASSLLTLSACAVGFGLSLLSSNIPTVPAIVVSLVVLGGIYQKSA